MTHIPTNLCFVFPQSPRKKPVVWRQEGRLALQLWETMPRSFAVWPTTSLLLLAASQFASPAREDDKFWDRFFDAALGPYGRPHQSLQELHDFQTAYGMDPGGVQRGPGRGIPRDGQGRGSMYEGPEWGAFGKSRRRHAWHKATAWEYWIPGCLSTSSERFRKYFRIGRDRFDEIYSRAARSGEFHLHPREPMYAELHPRRPFRPGRAQLDKVPPLCLKMAASFRRLATGQSFASLSQEFRIGLSTLHKFDKQFLKWFRLTYWKEYVVGESGVGFDDYASIEKEEKVFRQFGLPGFVTCMDGVHLAWENAPFKSRWQYKGKEGFPTVVVNVHCTATGRIVYCGPIFPGAHNDKTMVHYDKLVDAMRHDALFKDCKWSTCVPNSTGSTHELQGCMTLCDSGYHEWQETMNGYKYPTTCAEGLWSAR